MQCEFLGSVAVRTQESLPKAWVPSLVGELRSHKLRGAAKKVKNEKVNCKCFKDTYSYEAIRIFV